MEGMSYVNFNQSEAAISAIDMSAHLWPGHEVPDEEAGLRALPLSDLRAGAGQADRQQEHRAAGQRGGARARAAHLRHRGSALG